ncbi:MAG TPA: ABC transporter permease [Anaerolineae bacterium]|nr:ABC transporter permease [Anaerolineae bacterium]
MRILDLALKDWQQTLREKQAAIFLVIMPIAFTAFMGFAFSQGSGQTDPRLPIGYVDQDNGSELSQSLYALLQTSTVVRPEPLTGDAIDQADAQVKQNKLAGMVIVPAGFNTRSADDLNVTLVTDMNATSGHTVRNAVQTSLVRLMGAAKIAEIGVDRLAQAQPFATDAARQQALIEATTRAVTAWSDSPLTVTVEKASALKETPRNATGFAQSSPGMIVQFAIMGLVTSASILVLERKTRTLSRLLTTSMKRWEIIAGHLLAMFGLVFMQVTLLVLVGQFLFGVNYLREPLAVLLIVVTLSAWVSTMGLFISTLAKGEEQVVLFALIAMFLFTALGGAWFPLEGTGPAFNTIGHITPAAWAMDGLQNVVVRGLGVESVLLPAGVLLAYAIAFFGLAVWRFKFE